MANGTIKTFDIIAKSKTGTIPANSNHAENFSADVVSGYKFVAWVNFSS